MEELIRKLKDPPKNAIALYVWQQVLNREGNVLESHDVFSLIAREAVVPLYGMSPSYIGLGMTGGYVWTIQANATKLAQIAQRVANGELPEDILSKTLRDANVRLATTSTLGHKRRPSTAG